MKRPSIAQFVWILWKEVTFKRLLLFTVLLMNLRIFTYFPGFRTLEEVWFVTATLIFILFYPVLKAKVDWRFNALEYYLLSAILTFMVLPTVTSHSVFGQPLLYGFLARRAVTLLFTWLLLINVWRRRWFSSEDLQVSLLALMWLTVCVYASMQIFLQPERYADVPVGFILGSGGVQSFAAPGFLFPFGTIYYTLRGVRERQKRYFLYALFIFCVGAGSSWRALSISITATLLFFVFRTTTRRRAFVLLGKLSLLTLATIGTLSVVQPSLVKNTYAHFETAISVATGGKAEGKDSSADARVSEIAIATPYIKSHPFLGVGTLSAQWGSGNAAILGGPFSDSDIGLLGTIFSFGTVGLVLGSLQYSVAVQAALQTPRHLHSALLDGARGYVLFSALFSVTTGFFVVSIENSSFFVLLTVFLARDLRNKAALENPVDDSLFSGGAAPPSHRISYSR